MCVPLVCVLFSFAVVEKRHTHTQKRRRQANGPAKLSLPSLYHPALGHLCPHSLIPIPLSHPPPPNLYKFRFHSFPFHSIQNFIHCHVSAPMPPCLLPPPLALPPLLCPPPLPAPPWQRPLAPCLLLLCLLHLKEVAGLGSETDISPALSCLACGLSSVSSLPACLWVPSMPMVPGLPLPVL